MNEVGDYLQLSDWRHVITRPEMYLGNSTSVENLEYCLNEEMKIQAKQSFDKLASDLNILENHKYSH